MHYLSLKTDPFYTHDNISLKESKISLWGQVVDPGLKTDQTQPRYLFQVLCLMVNELMVKPQQSYWYAHLCPQGSKPPFSLSETFSRS